MNRETNSSENDRVYYEQNHEHARSLNAHLHRIPPLAMTLTGGIWFAVGIKSDIDIWIKSSLLFFTGVSNLFLILVSLKIRDVFQSYLEWLEEFNSDTFVKGSPKSPTVKSLGKYTMLIYFMALMFFATFISFLGVIHTLREKDIWLLVIISLLEIIVLILFWASINWKELSASNNADNNADE